VLVFGGCAGGDEDLDGVCAAEDCDDTDPAAGEPVLRFADEDSDGFGDPSISSLRCDDDGPWVDNALDCDDTLAAVHPGARERPGDGVDGDCDGREQCFQDLDGDGWRTGKVIESADSDCLDRFEAEPGSRPLDCADLDPTVSPGADDVCGDGVDADCDGVGGWESDEDGDGLSWLQEQEQGTSDCAQDTDGDGLADARDLDPLVPEVEEGRGAEAGSGGCSHGPSRRSWVAFGVVFGAARRRRRCSA
jgi:hypothetical protein